MLGLWCEMGYERIAVGITGASGIIYGIRTVEALIEFTSSIIEVVASKSALVVARHEMDMDLEQVLVRLSEKYPNRIRVYRDDDFSSPLASSSNLSDVMVIVPCSMKTLAELSHGIASNLISRAALSMLRLGRKLVVVPRETPVGVIELENMLKLARAGAIILPASPGFYNKPRNIDDIVSFIVGKILDVLGIKNTLYRRWSGK